MKFKLQPKLLTSFHNYTKKDFFNDITAGVIVGIVALPMAIAFAIASGVRPEQGLYTAIVAGFLIALLSGSKIQIGGPTGAFVIVIFSIMQQYGYTGLAVATFMAGLILIIMGCLGLGSVIRYIPYPVTVGFTSGIALIIFVGQIKDLFGLSIVELPADFVPKVIAIAKSFSTINYWATGIGLFALALLIFWPKITHKVPASLIAIIVPTILVQIFHLPVETIGSKFGAIPVGFPKPQMPEFSIAMIKTMFPSALTIAFLAAIESLLSALVADGMTGEKHNSNMELVAQGTANMASVIFMGIPATGAIARTATNIKNGGKTPIAGIIHAFVLLLILFFFGKYAALIPLSALAAILIIVAYNMSEYKLFLRMFKGPKSDIIVLLITFLLTVFVDLTVAIEVGMVLAAFLFMQRMYKVSEASFVGNGSNDVLAKAKGESFALSDREIPTGVEVFEIYGPFFFGVADKFKDALNIVDKKPQVLIVRMRHVPSLDVTGLRALRDIFYKTKHEGTVLLLSGVNPQPHQVMQKLNFLTEIGEEQVFDNFEDTLNRAIEITKK